MRTWRPHKRMSLSRRLTLAMSAMLVPLVVLAAAGLLFSRNSLAGLEDFRSETVGESQPIEHLRELLVLADDVGEEQVEHQDPLLEARFHELGDEIDREFADLQTLSTAQERGLARAAHSRWTRAFEAVHEAAGMPAGRDGARLDEFHDLIDESAAMVADVYALNVDQVATEITYLQDREALELLGAFGILIVSLLAAGLLARRVRDSIAGPLGALEHAAVLFGSAKLSHRIPISGDDEIAQVSRAFNAMADRLEQSTDDLQYQALHDPLTGLANRTLFMELMARAIARSDRRDRPFSVLYLDLDGFKAINDTMGHEVGDELLVSFSAQMKAALRDEDTAARLGGDEFAILLEEADAFGATETAQRLLVSLGSKRGSGAAEVPISFSIGVASRQDGQDLDQLLRQADAAMYAAKAAGKGQWQFFGPTLDADVIAKQQLRRDLQGAVDRKEFVVHYQPVVDLRTGAIQGVEALVRWNHPDRGVLPPAEFLTEAEETGHVLFIDRWVLGEACTQVRSWQARFPEAIDLCAYVNLSSRQLQHPGLAQEVAEVLTRTGLAPSSLTLEITETALVKDTSAASNELQKLRDLGVRVALDDFGTGFSSLTHLASFPIDVIKIDRSFVSSIGTAGERSELVQALIKMAKAMGMKTVAEGIERKDQFSYLQALDCELAQGYFLSRPVDPQKLEELLLAGVPVTPEPAATVSIVLP